MRKLYSLLRFPNHHLLSLIMSAMAISAGIILVLTSGTPTSDKTGMTSEWKILQTKIDSLQARLNEPSPTIDMSSLTQTMRQLSKQLEEVRTQNAHHVDQALNQTENLLVRRLEAIQTMVQQLETKQKQIHYLPANQLPFHVLSLDSIQHIPVASIAYDFKTIPIEKGESLAGWIIIAMDYGKQRIEFENKKKERVLLTHEHIG